MKKRGVVLFFISVAAIVSTICARSSAQDVGSTPVTILTWQNDQARTGQNLNEGTLVYNSLSKSTFGQRCSVQLDGQVYAQPLVLTHGKINGITYNYVVYVVTENDTLYAINGAPPAGTGGTCGPTQSLSFLTTGATPVDCTNVGHMDCMAIGPKVGMFYIFGSLARSC